MRIPIKQFKKLNNFIFEKNYILDKEYKIKEIFKKALQKMQKSLNLIKH
jgi:hypothetical protein